MSRAATSGIENYGLFSSVPYEWSAETKCGVVTKYLADEAGNMLYYKAPTHMGILAICAYFKITKGLDIKFANNQEIAKLYFDDLINKRLSSQGIEECSGLIYATDLEDCLPDSEEIGHVIPVFTASYLRSPTTARKAGELNVASFFLDSVGMASEFGYDFAHEVVVEKLSTKLDERLNNLLPLFATGDDTQIDLVSCGVKSLVDLARSCREFGGALDTFKDIVAKVDRPDFICSPRDVLQIDVPAILHKTTQDKKLIACFVAKKGGEAVRKDGSRKRERSFAEFTATNIKKFKEVSRGKDGSIVDVREVEKPAYLFGKSESYVEKSLALAMQDPEKLLGVMLEQCVADAKYKESLISCFRERFTGHLPGNHPSLAGVVAAAAKDFRAGKAI